MGNEGQATSFFNARNEELGADLAKALKETNQDVPDFLLQYLEGAETSVWGAQSSNAGAMDTPARPESPGWGPAPKYDGPASQVAQAFDTTSSKTNGLDTGVEAQTQSADDSQSTPMEW